ncbi:hypothetical protein SAMN04488074_1493 [Lentzea albidocapillata subsp. violacea]|uniref:Uncharacterized protein n=1 Tax=Lentzea albidocapillata subsp. violacea TaxID=128104 RepID=A0A1H0AMD2_9PSEU|nr:hypothetical protein [Lentzea albidocapillata]SDN33996.1 hypothetical protein SAMN04488074_1493 [Lentzea albidocapillata subsp. violacea]
MDALIGYSLAGDPAERFALICWVNAQPVPVHTPSGLDVTGVPTATLCAGHHDVDVGAAQDRAPGAREASQLYIADISVPPLLYRRMGIEVGDLFGNNSIVMLDAAAA